MKIKNGTIFNILSIVFLGCLLIAAAAPLTKEIRAEKFILVNSNGNERAMFCNFPDGSSGIVFIDLQGKARLAIGMPSNGEANIRILNELGQVTDQFPSIKYPKLNQSSVTIQHKNSDKIAIVGDIKLEIKHYALIGQHIKSLNQFHPDKNSDTTKFVKVMGIVTNMANMEIQTMGTCYIIDQKNRRYSEMESSTFYIDNSRDLSMTTLKPSIPKKFTAIFEVPLDSEPQQFVAVELGELFSNKEVLIPIY